MTDSPLFLRREEEADDALLAFEIEAAFGVTPDFPALTADLSAAADLWRAGVYLPTNYEIEE